MNITKKKAAVFIVSILTLLVIILPIAAHLIANSRAKSKVADFTKSFQNDCSISYGDVFYNIINRHLKISDILISCFDEKTAFIKEAEFNHIVSGNPIPLNVQADLRNGVVYPSAKIFGKYGEYSSKLGYDNINFQGSFTYTLGRVSKEFNLVSLTINAENIGSLQGQMKIADVYNADIKIIYNNILNNKPASFNFCFSDKGLKNNVITKYMQIANVKEDAINEKIKNAVYKRAVESDNKTKENYYSLEKFLLSSSNISINLLENSNKSIYETINSFDITGYRKMLNSIKNFDIELVAQ